MEILKKANMRECDKIQEEYTNWSPGMVDIQKYDSAANKGNDHEPQILLPSNLAQNLLILQRMLHATE